LNKKGQKSAYFVQKNDIFAQNPNIFVVFI